MIVCIIEYLRTFRRSLLINDGCFCNENPEILTSILRKLVLRTFQCLKPIPGISDHEALFIDSDVQAKLRRPTSRKIFLWKNADLEKLQYDMQAFCQSFISKFPTSHPVDSLWTTFKNGCLNVLSLNVLPKMTTERYSQLWINRQIKQLTKRKQRAYNRYKTTPFAKDYANYKHLKNMVHITCVKRYNEYVNDIIMD